MYRKSVDHEKMESVCFFTITWKNYELKRFKDGASFCYCAYVLCISGLSGFLRNLPLIQQHFCAAYDYVEKADLRAIRIQKENRG